MSRKPNYYSQSIAILQDLHRLYPNWNMGRHIATALDGYGDVWGITDKELVFLLDKYKTRMDIDIEHSTDQDELDKIIKEGMDLDNLFKEDEDNGDY